MYDIERERVLTRTSKRHLRGHLMIKIVYLSGHESKQKKVSNQLYRFQGKHYHFWYQDAHCFETNLKIVHNFQNAWHVVRLLFETMNERNTANFNLGNIQ